MCTHAVYYNVVLSGPLPNDDNFFIIADYYLGNVYQLDATTGVTGQLLPLGVRRLPRSLAYDPTAKLIYWADSYAHTINRYSLLTNNSTVIYRDPSNAGKDSSYLTVLDVP